MESLTAVFAALADPSRVRILMLVRQLELAMGELADVLGQSQPRVSRHVRILAEAGLVERVREGAFVFVRAGGLAAPALALLDVLTAAEAANGPAWAAADRARLGLVRAERAVAADAWFAANAAQWDRERSLFTREADVEAGIVAALAAAPVGDLVDVGTGTGRMIELLGPAARSAIGVDRSPEMLRLARGRIEARGLAHARVQAGDFYALPLADAAADTLVLHQVLHFADDPQAALTECARVLRPGGRLLVIDLMPHQDEALASRQRHARLGFA
ncbi:MAG: metalloregulator ArsR/SmtB family transcription factor, partial [Sphingomonadales bacterium]